ncbi:MAG: hypothetical protein MRY83_18145 [Flavobacteriales bacterium]|nr:hypothetical protein [Flavobacteriales bacterium]
MKTYSKFNSDILTTVLAIGIQSIGLVIILFIIFNNPLHASNRMEKSDSIHVNIQVLSEGEPQEFAILELYEQNDLIQHAKATDEGTLGFDLFSDGFFTIVVSEDGYVTKKIQIKTTGLGQSKHQETLNLDLNLEHIDQFGDLADADLDFPFAIIIFDSKHHCFKFDEDFVMNMKTYQNSLID